MPSDHDKPAKQEPAAMVLSADRDGPPCLPPTDEDIGQQILYMNRRLDGAIARTAIDENTRNAIKHHLRQIADLVIYSKPVPMPPQPRALPRPWMSAPVPVGPAPCPDPIVPYASAEDEKRHSNVQQMTPPPSNWDEYRQQWHQDQQAKLAEMKAAGKPFLVDRKGSGVTKNHYSADGQRTLCGLDGKLQEKTQTGEISGCKTCNAIAAKGDRRT